MPANSWPLPDNLADCHTVIREQQEVLARLQEQRAQIQRQIDALKAIDLRTAKQRLFTSSDETR